MLNRIPGNQKLVNMPTCLVIMFVFVLQDVLGGMGHHIQEIQISIHVCIVSIFHISMLLKEYSIVGCWLK